MIRRVTEYVDIDAPILSFIVGVLAGLILPCLLHVAADRFGWSRRVLLGLTAPSKPDRREGKNF